MKITEIKIAQCVPAGVYFLSGIALRVPTIAEAVITAKSLERRFW